jgi:CRP-like cAMP-binding protein
MHEQLREYINKVTGTVISDEEFRHIAAAFDKKSMKKRQFLLHEGGICKHIAFIVKGAMRQYRIDEKGTEHIVRFGIEGWWMSDRQSFINLTPSRYNIEALEDCDLLVSTNEKITPLMELSPAFVRMSHLLDQNNYIASEARIQASISYTAEERFIYLMNTYPDFLKRFPQNMLASYLGITPETFSRVRKQVLSK